MQLTSCGGVCDTWIADYVQDRHTALLTPAVITIELITLVDVYFTRSIYSIVSTSDTGRRSDRAVGAGASLRRTKSISLAGSG